MGNGSISILNNNNKDNNKSNKENKINNKNINKQTLLSDRFLNLTIRRKEEKERLLRLRILDDIKINFGKVTIIMLFAPPEFPIDDIAEYLSKKVDLPIIKVSNISNEQEKVGIYGIEENEQHFKMVQIHEETMMKYVEKRLSEQECQNGCILLNFPQSPKQYSFLCQLNTAEHIPLFFDIDSQV